MKNNVYDLTDFINGLKEDLKFNKLIEELKVDAIFKGKLNDDVKYKIDYSYDNYSQYLNDLDDLYSQDEKSILNHIKNAFLIYDSDELSFIEKPKMIASYFNMASNIIGIDKCDIEDLKVFSYVSSYLNNGSSNKYIKILLDKDVYNLVFEGHDSFDTKVNRAFIFLNGSSRAILHDSLYNISKIITNGDVALNSYKKTEKNEKSEFLWYFKNEDITPYFNEIKVLCESCDTLWHMPRSDFFTEEELLELQDSFKKRYEYAMCYFPKAKLNILKDEIESFYIRHYETENKKTFDFLELEYPKLCPSCRQEEYKNLGLTSYMVEELLENELTK